MEEEEGNPLCSVYPDALELHRLDRGWMKLS